MGRESWGQYPVTLTGQSEGIEMSVKESLVLQYNFLKVEKVTWYFFGESLKLCTSFIYTYICACVCVCDGDRLSELSYTHFTICSAPNSVFLGVPISSVNFLPAKRKIGSKAIIIETLAIM